MEETGVARPLMGFLELVRRFAVRGLAAVCGGIGHRVQRRRFEAAYRRAALSLSGIVDVRFRDNGQYIDVCTIYRGYFDALEDQVYDLEATMLAAYPAVHPDWRIMEDSAVAAETVNVAEHGGVATVH